MKTTVSIILFFVICIFIMRCGPNAKDIHITTPSEQDSIEKSKQDSAATANTIVIVRTDTLDKDTSVQK